MNIAGVASPSLRRFALGTAALLLAGCKGLGATGGCPVAGACGGDPVGVWQVNPALICNFPVVARPAQNYATPPYFQPETGATPPAVTSGSWCWDLTFTKDRDGTVTVATPSVPMARPDVVVSGMITFSADHSYVYVLTAQSTTNFHVARSCFGVNGAGLSCADLAVKLQQSSIGVNPVYSNPSGGSAFACDDVGDGCDCSFDYLESDQFGSAVGDKGTWTLDGNVIHHYSSGGQGNLNEISPSRRTVRDATFCVTDNGQTLQLSGTNGQALSLKAGARTLTLTRVLPDAGIDASDGARTPNADGGARADGEAAGDAGDGRANGVDTGSG